MQTITIPFQITKVDEDQRRVWGVATSEALDSQGDVLDYEASKKAITDWMKVGNIREMHDGNKAVGKAFDAQFNDNEKSITVGSYISRSADGENTWTKVKEGILTGYSVGGQVHKSVIDKVKEAASGATRTINRVTDWAMSELSLVDNPANPEAQIVMVKSKDGKSIDYIDMEKFFETFDKKLDEAIRKNDLGVPVAWWVNKYQNEDLTKEGIRKYKIEQISKLEKRDFSDKQRQAMADKGQALPDGSFPIANKTDLANAIKAYGRAKNKSAAKKHIIQRAKDLGATDMLPDNWNAKNQQPVMTKRAMLKDFMGTARVVDIACQLTWFLEGEIAEGDEETANAVKAALDALKQAAVSELDEVGEEDAEALVVAIEYGLKAVDLKKSELKKTGAAVVDGDPRDTNANSVAEATPTTPVKGGTKVTKDVIHADGKSKTTKANEAEDLNKIVGTTPNPDTPPRVDNTTASETPRKADEDDDEAGTTDGKADAATENGDAAPPATQASDAGTSASADGSADAATPVDGSGTASIGSAEAATDASPAATAVDQTTTTSDSADGKPDAATEEDEDGSSKSQIAELQKALSTVQSQVNDITKSQGLEKAVTDLTTLVKENLSSLDERLKKFENRPQPIKTQASYLEPQEVVKGHEDKGTPVNKTEGLSDTEIVSLFKRADELSAHPSAGTPQERGELFRKLWNIKRDDYEHLIK